MAEENTNLPLDASVEKEISKLMKEASEVLSEMRTDGFDLNEDDYLIEHHFACRDFAKLEKLAVDLDGLGYDVGEADELQDMRNRVIFCFDALKETALSESIIKAQLEEIIPLASKYGVEYDGWGIPMDDYEDDYEEDDAEEE